MKIAIRNYERTDESQLLDLFPYEKDLVYLLRSSNLTCVYVAVVRDEIVGIIIAWTNQFHPYCTYFRILIVPFCRQKNIESTLFNMLLRNKKVEYPLQTSIFETSSNLKSFYKENGFTEIRRTHLPRLKIKELSSKQFNFEVKGIQTLSEISKDRQLMEKLTILVKDVYEETHVDNPVAKLSLHDWEQLIMADDIMMDGSLIYLDANEVSILAYSFLHYAEDNETLELGWCGSVSQYIHLLPQLVLSQIVYANRLKFQFITGEFDTTSKYAMKVLQHIPFPTSDAWITYQKSYVTE